MNMSRYSDLSERTYRRQYAASFPYVALNRQLIELVIPATVRDGDWLTVPLDLDVSARGCRVPSNRSATD
jgi:hypothetical protein